MPELYEVLPRERQLALAVRARRPAELARLFAAHAGQFYDRAAFDDLAREVHALYAQESDDNADHFRRRLDRQLRDHHHAPVGWDVGPDGRAR